MSAEAPRAETLPAEAMPWRVCGRAFDPARRTLGSGGERQTLSPPVSRLLDLLVRHAGRPLEREWLLEQAWNGADVSDESLSKAVSTLRRLLDDREHQAIQTVHGVGYQFEPSLVEKEPDSCRHAPPGPVRERNPLAAPRWALLAASVILALAILASPVFQRAERQAPDSVEAVDFRMAGPVNLTFQPGRETTPELSPDGARFAYVRAGKRNEMVIGSVDDPTQVTTLAEDALFSRWSPDGERLAIVIPEEGRSFRIDVIDADGSNARTVAHTFVLGPVEWTPDLGALVFPDLQGERSVNLFLQPLEGEIDRTPLLPLTEPIIRVNPRISPDGRYLAYREGAFPESRLVIREWSADGAEVYRGGLDQSVRGHDWSPDSDAVYLAMTLGQSTGIWRLDLEPAPREPQLLRETPSLKYLSVSRADGAVAYSTERAGTEIVLLQTVPNGYRQLEQVASTEVEAHPSLSPSGKRLAFLSNRTGSWAVWIRATNDAEPRQLSLPGGAVGVTPAWSADGEHLLAAWARNGSHALAKIHVASGDVETLGLPTGSSVKALALAGDESYPVVSLETEDQGTRILARQASNWRVLSTIDAVRLATEPASNQVLAAEASGFGLWAIDLDGSGQHLLNVPINPLTSRRWSLIEQGLLISRSHQDGTWLERWRRTEQGVEFVVQHRLAEADYRSQFSASWNGEVVALDARSGIEENIHLLRPISPTLLAER